MGKKAIRRTPNPTSSQLDIPHPEYAFYFDIEGYQASSSSGNCVLGSIAISIKLLLQEAGAHLEAFLVGRVYGLEPKDLERRVRASFFSANNLMRSTSIPRSICIHMHSPLRTHEIRISIRNLNR